MTHQVANEYLEQLMKQGEDSYFETFPNKKREDYNPDMYPFLLGFLQSDFKIHLIKQNEIVLS